MKLIKRIGAFFYAAFMVTLIILQLLGPKTKKSRKRVIRKIRRTYPDYEIAEVIRERFGQEADIWRSTQDSFYIKVPISVSPAFYGWVFRFGGMIRIVSPATVREDSGNGGQLGDP